MPVPRPLHEVARRVLHRWPASKSVAIAVLEPLYRVALWPFRLKAARGRAEERPELVARTDAYNQAAEDYYTRVANRTFLLNKPFSEAMAAGTHLIDAGVLMQALRLQPGDTVVEIGAGSCWLSHFLNRYGCRTIAVDVSPTALEIGRALFERDLATNWALDPRFAAYDGRTLPIPDGTCDRAIINDAFHHIPNQAELLGEIVRVLAPDGVLGMSEPGRGHGAHEQSRMEASTGVLENELVLEDLAALARRCGFAATNVIVAGDRHPFEIPAADLAAFCGGKHFPLFWRKYASALEGHHYLLFYKRHAAPTTRRPGRLAAKIAVASGAPTRPLRAGERLELTLSIRNAGDTRWLAAPDRGRGWTRLGAHLLKGDGEAREMLDFDWFRMDLPADVPPGDAIAVRVALPAIDSPGAYLLVFDLVIEDLAWCAEQGSSTCEVRVQVA